ncbi:uncharacterized protein TNCV_349631 [Trichonephila clavipes]|nr:uncharacterized protein TNCV_349631 [Trichonephila clavipes]
MSVDRHTASLVGLRAFLDSPLTVSPHSSLNTSRGAISEPDLLTTPEAELLDGFSDQGVIQVRRITIKKYNSVIPTNHLILTFYSPTLPKTIKAGYLNCKIRPYIPNPLRCFQCQRQIVSTSTPTVSTSSASTQAHLLPSTSTISESQSTIPTFNTNDPQYLADQAIVKKSRKRLLPKYNEKGTSFLQISKSNIPTKFIAIAVKKFFAQKLPLIPRREKRSPKTICKDIEIKMTPYKQKKSTPLQDKSNEEDMFEEEEINYIAF